MSADDPGYALVRTECWLSEICDEEDGFVDILRDAGAVVLGQAEVNHPGVKQLNADTAARSGATIQTGESMILAALAGGRFRVIFRTPAAFVSTSSRVFRAGVAVGGDGYNTAAGPSGMGQGVWGEYYGSSSFRGFACQLVGGKSSQTPTAFDLSTNTWYRFEWEVSLDRTAVIFRLFASDTATLVWADRILTAIPELSEEGPAFASWWATGPTATAELGRCDFISLWQPTPDRDINLSRSIMHYENLCRDTTTSTGTGNLTLSGTPPTGYQALSVHGTGTTNRFEYNVENATRSEWEIGIGYLSASTTLVRVTVLDSSNSGSLVSFTSGVKVVRNVVAADSLNILYARGSSATVVHVDGGTTIPTLDQTGSERAPFATLVAAVAALTAGGTIVIAPGAYSESPSLGAFTWRLCSKVPLAQALAGAAVGTSWAATAITLAASGALDLVGAAVTTLTLGGSSTTRASCCAITDVAGTGELNTFSCSHSGTLAAVTFRGWQTNFTGTGSFAVTTLRLQQSRVASARTITCTTLEIDDLTYDSVSRNLVTITPSGQATVLNGAFSARRVAIIDEEVWSRVSGRDCAFTYTSTAAAVANSSVNEPLHPGVAQFTGNTAIASSAWLATSDAICCLPSFTRCVCTFRTPTTNFTNRYFVAGWIQGLATDISNFATLVGLYAFYNGSGVLVMQSRNFAGTTVTSSTIHTLSNATWYTIVWDYSGTATVATLYDDAGAIAGTQRTISNSIELTDTAGWGVGFGNSGAQSNSSLGRLDLFRVEQPLVVRAAA